MAALIGAGVIARPPRLRLSSLAAKAGWPPGRLGSTSLRRWRDTPWPPLQHKTGEYIRGPQYFQSIQLYDAEQSVRHAIEALGEDTLMFATDYPHSES